MAEKRPKVSERSVTVRLPRPMLKAVDDFADDTLAKRSQAVRVLISRGLKASARKVV